MPPEYPIGHLAQSRVLSLTAIGLEQSKSLVVKKAKQAMPT
jgi:hypothetical protein